MAGNIVKIKEGGYRLRYRDYSKYVKAKSDRDAEKQLARFVSDVDSGEYKQPSKMSFEQFAEKWISEYAEVRLGKKTLHRYKEMLASRIYPAIGKKKLDKIKPLDLMEFYNSMRKPHAYISFSTGKKKQTKGLSEKSIKHHHSLISTIFEKAIHWGVMAGDNPAKRVDPPKPQRTKARCYDREETLALIEILNSLDQSEDRYRVACMIAIMTGARLGEIVGLEWQDIDFERKELQISRASQYVPGHGTFTKEPKTETSVRKISLNETLIEILKEYRSRQRERGFLCADNNRLFVSSDGKPMHTYKLTDWFPRFLKKHGLPPLNFHGLRHTSATFLISEGMDIQTVAGRLGHSTSATTMNIYSHFLESKDRKAAELMEDAFSNSRQKTS